MMTDRLSQLPDDLLRRILHFAPLKEAAATTALSRRWRQTPPLWPSSAAVNLEIRRVQVNYEHQASCLHLFSQRESFFSEAVAALDAADVPVTRLTLRIKGYCAEAVGDFLTHDYMDEERDLVGVLLSHRAPRRVEELRIFLEDCRGGYVVGCAVAVRALPLETLRVLELTDCKLVYPTPTQEQALVLPRLSSLRLRRCHQRLSSLQRLIHAAPALASLSLHHVRIYVTTTSTPLQAASRSTGRLPLALGCPTATTLVLDSCWWEQWKRSSYHTVHGGMEIHAPRLRHFRYIGQLRSLFSLRPQPLELEKIDLDDYYRDDLDLAATLWPLIGSFTSVKEMRLRVHHLESMAVLTEARRVELLPTFHRLQRLHLQAVHWNKGDTAAVTIMNLLRCCPVLSAFRINLTTDHKAQQDASNNNNKKKKKERVRSRIPQKIMHIPALAPQRSLECLRNTLRIVGLHFSCLDDTNCLGVKLLDLFAENAMLLQEMYINGRDQKLCDHVNHNTPRWNSRRRNSGATCFRVLPLKR